MLVGTASQVTSNKRKSLLNEDLGELALLGLFALMPFSFYVNSTLFASVSVFGMSPISAVTAFVVVICAIGILMRRQRALNYGPLLASVLIVFIVMVKILLQDGYGEIVRWMQQYQYYLLVPLMLFVVMNLKMSVKRLIDLSLAISWPVCLISFYSFMSSDYFGIVPYSTMEAYAIVGTPYYRMMGPFGSPNVAGSYYAIMLFSAILTMKAMRPRQKNGYKILQATQVMLLAVCLTLSFSRMAFIGFVLSLVLLLMGDDQNGKRSARRFLAGLMLVALAILLIIWFANSGLYFWSFEDFINNPRWEKWVNFLDNFGQWLILGTSFGVHIVSGTTTLSDNSILLLIGAIGFVPAVLYFVLLIRPVVAKCNTQRQLRAFGAMLLVFLLLSDFISLYPSAYLTVPIMCYTWYSKECSREFTNYHSVMPISAR